MARAAGARLAQRAHVIDLVLQRRKGRGQVAVREYLDLYELLAVQRGGLSATARLGIRWANHGLNRGRLYASSPGRAWTNTGLA